MKILLRKGNKLYLTQIIIMTLLLLFTISCYHFIYIYQSKWWVFGAIGIGVIVGISSAISSKKDIYYIKIN